MTSEQKQYYNSLQGNNKIIVQAALFQATSMDSRRIAELVRPYIKIFIAQSNIKSVMQRAVEHGLFHTKPYKNDEYEADLDCLIALYPGLGNYQRLWPMVGEGRSGRNMFYYYDETNLLVYVRACLYTMWFNNNEYADAEDRFFRTYPSEISQVYYMMAENELYRKKLALISSPLLQLVCSKMFVDKLNSLYPITEMEAFINQLISGSGKAHEFDDEKAFIQNLRRIWQGEFDKAKVPCGYNICHEEFVIEALRGDADKAWSIAQQQITAANKADGTKFPFFTPSIDVYYALLTLRLVDKKVAMPIYEKLIQWDKKRKSSDVSFYAPFYAMVYDIASSQQEMTDHYADMAQRLALDNSNPLSALARIYAVLVCYMVGRKIEATDNNCQKMQDLCEQAETSENYLAAYELAYGLYDWYDTVWTRACYSKLRKRLKFTPLISRVPHQSGWERKLNLLLSLNQSKPAGKSVAEKDSRVAYYFNPEQPLDLQPIMQVQQTKGWSKGRAIAFSTFYKGEVDGMTEQDMRVARCLEEGKYSAGWYYSSSVKYSFNSKALYELIGHPHIFLAGANRVSVEFVEGVPTISVEKSRSGYKLFSNVEHTAIQEMVNIFAQKETNTRYKIFRLTQTQREIISIISNEQLLIPKEGTEKLTELLGVFAAAGMNIHSDLLGNDDASVPVKEVPTDSRVRIQLLPYGDGLKAELFSKPFGTLPPYCKPGKGGKALIAHQGEEQLQVQRNLKAEAANEQALMEEIQALESLDISDGLMSFGDPLDSLQVLDIASRHTDQCVVEWPEGERFKLRGTVGTGNLKMQIKSGINWFDLSGELQVSEETVLTLQQLLALTAKSHRQFVELKPGEYLALSKELKKQLDAIRLFSTEEKGKTRLNTFASAALEGVFDEMKNLKVDKKWKEFRQKLSAASDVDIQVPDNLQAELRPYQEEGFRWMSRLAEWDAGACLADEMGLGKTLQSLAVLLHRANKGPALVICPVSLIGNWTAEAERFAPSLQVKTLSHTGNGRREVLESLQNGDLLVTSYGLLQSESDLFAEFHFATIILDEAHVIKNHATKTSKATMELKGDFRLILTGTPIQNHLGEIWNLFGFINPGLLGSQQHFNDTFVKGTDEQTPKYLKKLISPFILRRTKASVMDELPPKTEIVKRIALSSEEMAFYEALRRQAVENLSGEGGGGAKHIQVLAEITRLRQACCNPLLIDPKAHIASTKLSTLLTLVDELRENKHKALIFSQFVTHLAIVREALDKQGITYQYIDGSTPVKERQKRVDAFQNGKGELFLISLKAGGLGLNLTAADYVIHLDPWWNPAIEDQASDRAHRIGQTRPVTIYRLVAENTIEEKILQLHHHKRDMAESLLEGSDMAAKLSLEEIMELLKE
ncbi:MAG: DEAD/DEAH box helicase [Mediterranea sp.]|jgi:superfamily II DNA or RNA helicase|nr:DEAD/DEAH box helicase [Mediterranea sp.]